MRTYGRVTRSDGTKAWVQVDTDAKGFNDQVYLTTLLQCLKLNLGESPFYAQYGIPAHFSVVRQVFPDFYVNLMQGLFSPYFASLRIQKLDNDSPTYNVSVITNVGAKIEVEIPA